MQLNGLRGTLCRGRQTRWVRSTGDGFERIDQRIDLGLQIRQRQVGGKACRE